MSLSDIASASCMAVSLFFFTAGTVGLLRLPDLQSRLHALTKADNVGLGFAILAVAIQADGGTVVFKLVLIWLLILAAGANVCYLIASRARRDDSPASGGGKRT